MPITTLGIGAAVTPTVVKTTFSHYINRKPRAKKPTAHISYDQGLHLIRSFLLYASHHTVEEVQAFTGQWVPHPAWIRTENVCIPADCIDEAADLLTAELGQDGVEAIGGTQWWRWRRKDAELKAEWIEMRSDFNARQRDKSKGRRVMLYVHGGGYFFGSVDEHRYQLQRHARKLKARVFAPRYRLAPQFPFPCGLLDCLAAYQYLLTIHEPSEIIFAGDSAGGGMILSMLCLLRDRGAPLPAGAILISPWVDLTHSFPSLTRDDDLDYLPVHGFMQKPSRSWPPPNEDELKELLKAAGAPPQSDKGMTNDDAPKKVERVDTLEAANIARKRQPPLSVVLNGKEVVVKEQIQLYTTNQLITHPLVSPALQPSLGGLPPLLVMVGGGERLRDEQIYVAHKAANPSKYKLPDRWRKLYDPDDAILREYKPTPVQLQVWEDLCHVAPTLSFTRPAKFMYRSVAQFGAWALSRAQRRSIEIMDDAQSETSSDSSEDESAVEERLNGVMNRKLTAHGLYAQVGKAGDPLPPFRDNMIREQVDRHGNIYPLPHANDLPAMQMDHDLVGVVKEGPTRCWMSAKQEWDHKYASIRRKVHKQRLQAVQSGQHHDFGPAEHPPPSALAGRQYDAMSYWSSQRLKKSWGLGMWSSWSWKHDEKTLQREDHYPKTGEQQQEPDQSKLGAELSEPKHEERKNRPRSASRTGRTSGRRKTVSVRDEGQVEGEAPIVPQIPNATTQNGAVDVPPVPAPIFTINAPAPSVADQPVQSEQSVPPVFIPKWKNAAYLRDESKDISDASSAYSHSSRLMPDNASTMAVFSAPGVRREHSTGAPQESGKSGGQMPLDVSPNTPAITDNLGGYDTPVSRRSVERLQSHQLDLADGQSVHSSLPASAMNEPLSPRMQSLRSPSAMAVVQAEGVISPMGEDALPADVPASSAADNVAQGGDSEAGQKAASQVIPQAMESAHHAASIEPSQESDGEKTPTIGKRPGMYDRQDSDFVTANEVL